MAADWLSKFGNSITDAFTPNFFFTIVMDELTKRIQDEISWCIVFADDIILIDQIRDRLNSNLEQWRHILKSKEFKLSRSMIEYLNFRSRGVEQGSEDVTMGEVAIARAEKFRYLGSIIGEKWDVDEDINHHIRMGW